MKFRSVLVLAAAIGALVPSAAQAEHCATPIAIFTSIRTFPDGIDDPVRGGKIYGPPSANSAAVGCTVRDDVLASEEPAAHPATQTDIIYPGANRMSVRLLEHGIDPSIIVSATLTWAGETYTLDLKPTLGITGAPSTYMNSQGFDIDPADTLAGNAAVATICLVDEETCLTRTYKTLG